MKNKGALCAVSLVLLLVGGLNWGLVGLQMLFKSAGNWNVVSLIVGQWLMVEGIVYLLVGLAALKVIVMMAMGKKACMEEKM